jgi:protein-S-isoprenylcysteine O-methyltransferase Ste14
MRPLVLHDPVAEILLWGSLALWVINEHRLRVRSSSQGNEPREWTFFLIVLFLVGSIVGAALVASDRVAPLPGPAWWPVAAGLVLLWLGIALRLWAISTLGRFFKMTIAIQEGHRVIVDGPYRWLRHPCYTGTLLIAIGVGLAEGDWFSVAIMWVALTIALLTRIRAEERTLRAELGDEYAAYAQRTARLVPGLF